MVLSCCIDLLKTGMWTDTLTVQGVIEACQTLEMLTPVKHSGQGDRWSPQDGSSVVKTWHMKRMHSTVSKGPKRWHRNDGAQSTDHERRPWVGTYRGRKAWPVVRNGRTSFSSKGVQLCWNNQAALGKETVIHSTKSSHKRKERQQNPCTTWSKLNFFFVH